MILEIEVNLNRMNATDACDFPSAMKDPLVLGFNQPYVAAPRFLLKTDLGQPGRRRDFIQIKACDTICRKMGVEPGRAKAGGGICDPSILTGGYKPLQRLFAGSSRDMTCLLYTSDAADE